MRTYSKSVLGVSLAAVLGATPTVFADDRVQLVVGYKEGAEKFAGALDYADSISKRRDIEIIEVASRNVEGVRDTLASRPSVRYVEINHSISIPEPVEDHDEESQVMRPMRIFNPEPPITDSQGEPLFNDPGFNSQHYLASPDDSDEQYHQGGTAIEPAWDVTETWRTPRVAVLDTGASIYEQGMSWDGGVNLVTDDDIRDAEAGPDDWDVFPQFEDNGCGNDALHGQIVGSVMGAQQNNQFGIAGMFPEAEFHAVRVSPCRSGAATSDVVDGIIWAAGEDPEREGVERLETPMDVINLSLGGERDCTAMEQDAIDKAVDSGVVVVAATGNDSELDPSDIAPANCDGVMAVTGSDYDGDAHDSVTSGEGADIAAQSHRVMTENHINTDGTSQSGTSFAAPMVSASAAMIRANVPGVTPETVRSALQGAARAPELSEDSKEQGISETDLGAGIVDVNAALRLLAGVPEDKPKAQLSNPLTEADCTGVGLAAEQALEGVSEAPDTPRELIVHHDHERERAVLFEVTGKTTSDWTVSEAQELTSTEGQRKMVDVETDGDYGVQFCDSNGSEWECDDEALIPVDAS